MCECECRYEPLLIKYGDWFNFLLTAVCSQVVQHSAGIPKKYLCYSFTRPSPQPETEPITPSVTTRRTPPVPATRPARPSSLSRPARPSAGARPARPSANTRHPTTTSTPRPPPPPPLPPSKDSLNLFRLPLQFISSLLQPLMPPARQNGSAVASPWINFQIPLTYAPILPAAVDCQPSPSGGGGGSSGSGSGCGGSGGGGGNANNCNSQGGSSGHANNCNSTGGGGTTTARPPKVGSRFDILVQLLRILCSVFPGSATPTPDITTTTTITTAAMPCGGDSTTTTRPTDDVVTVVDETTVDGSTSPISNALPCPTDATSAADPSAADPPSPHVPSRAGGVVLPCLFTPAVTMAPPCGARRPPTKPVPCKTARFPQLPPSPPPLKSGLKAGYPCVVAPKKLFLPNLLHHHVDTTPPVTAAEVADVTVDQPQRPDDQPAAALTDGGGLVLDDGIVLDPQEQLALKVLKVLLSANDPAVAAPTATAAR